MAYHPIGRIFELSPDMFLWKRSQESEYQIEGLIGEGLTSCVYKAIRKHAKYGLEQTVALKVFKSTEQVSALKNEIQILQKIHSAHCVQYFGWTDLNNRPAIVLEYLDGVSLYEINLYSTLTDSLIHEICAQVQNGLKDLHEKGVWHGDVSPKNIFITSQGRIKLLDFGFSNKNQSALQCTPQYLSLEGWKGQGLTPASDLFSVGLLLQDLKEGFKRTTNDPSALLEKAHSLKNSNQLLRELPEERAFLNIHSTQQGRGVLAQVVIDIQTKKNMRSWTTKIIDKLVPLQKSKGLQKWAIQFVILVACVVKTHPLQPAPSLLNKNQTQRAQFKMDVRSQSWKYVQIFKKGTTNWVPIKSGYSPFSFKNTSGEYQIRWRGYNKKGIILVQFHKNSRILLE